MLRNLRIEVPGFLGWLWTVLVGLALAVALTGAGVNLPAEGLELPRGLGAPAWFLLLAAALIWLVRLTAHLLDGQGFSLAVAAAGVVGHALILFGLTSPRGLGGLMGVFSLFLAAGEIVRLIELRTAAARSRTGERRSTLPPRVDLTLGWAALAIYLLIVPASFL
jgi:hypothetical protein